MAGTRKSGTSLGVRQLASQSVMLFSGFALAQACSFLRNALIGHTLSRGDFGMAASITLTLQLCETLMDLGADRLIVQADDGNRPSLMASAHLVLVARGCVTALVLFLLAGPMTALFDNPDAKWAFQAIAIVPLIKGFLHLDMRRRQRRLENLPFIVVEVVPQMIALATTLPILYATNSYVAVVWIAVMQAVIMLATAHLVSQRRYRIGWNPTHIRRLWRFGWPIWLSALPLVAVYQGDRMIVGSNLGLEALADYTAAFMITMVPGLLAAKVGHALMLPILAERKNEPAAFTERTVWLGATVTLAALAYVCVFALLGDLAVTIAFGAKYTGLAGLIMVLAVMWALRMMQSVPGMALLATGHTMPLLIAGLIRASALLLAAAAALNGAGLAGIAAAGVIGEVASLIYVVAAMSKRCPFDIELLGKTLADLPIRASALGRDAVARH